MATPTQNILEPSAAPIALPGYQAQPQDSGVEHSLTKLREAAEDLSDFCPEPRWAPCLTEAETFGYRCTCAFQLIVEHDGIFHYAMRHKQTPVLLNAPSFPIATRRIQTVMEQLLKAISSHAPIMTQHLTSVSFASSWNDAPDCDIIVTLHYNHAIEDEGLWRTCAQEVETELHLTRLVGRSKGRRVVVDDAPVYLNDTIYIQPNTTIDACTVSLQEPPLAENSFTRVHYRKPETAFFHPNARAMTKALEWMLSRIPKSVNLLEMYCGCGAHTVALAKMGMLKQIVAVELDQRLVDACIVNCKLNECYGPDTSDATTPVHVFSGDASEWARKSVKQQSKGNTSNNKSSWYNHAYSVLLVDPPRMGLDEQVCNMAIQGTFTDMIYISCGRNALKRDLGRLQSHFKVVDLFLLDLFPRTDALESLVHLQRLDS